VRNTTQSGLRVLDSRSNSENNAKWQMFSKLLTPEKERKYVQNMSLFSKHAHTPKRLREPSNVSDPNDLSGRVRMVNLDAIRFTEADIQQEIEQKQKALRNIIENKVRQQCKVNLKKVKLARDRVPFAELQKRCRGEQYAANLVGCTRLQDFDGGKKPICSKKCQHDCKGYFATRLDIIRGELEEWWGVKSNYAHQISLLSDDLRLNCVRHEDQKLEIKYFVAGKQVCRDFYMCARGVHNSKLFQFEQNLVHNKSSSIGAAFQDRKTSDKVEPRKKNEIKTWLLLFAKYVGDKPPNECVAVLPYRQILPIWQEYIDDLTAAKFAYG
jgi:hypothetical protein